MAGGDASRRRRRVGGTRLDVHAAGRSAAGPARRLGGVLKELLEEAGIDNRRLYNWSRHTAGTILNQLGVDMPTIMEIPRHTQISQPRRYVKGRSPLSKDAMRRMGDAFMPRPESATETKAETTSAKAARARRRRHIR